MAETNLCPPSVEVRTLSDVSANSILELYEDNLNKAAELARRGHASAMEMVIGNLEEYAQKAGVPCDSDRIKIIREEGFLNRFNSELNLAADFAEKGNDRETETCVATARFYAKKAGLPEKDVTSLLKTISLKAYEGWLKTATDYAHRGIDFSMERAMERAMPHADQAGLLREEVQARFKEIFFVAYKIYLNNARHHAELGQDSHMCDAIRSAKTNAEKAGLTPPEVEGLLKTIYEKAFAVKIREASALNTTRDAGTVEMISHALDHASSYAKKAGIKHEWER